MKKDQSHAEKLHNMENGILNFCHVLNQLNNYDE
jgi:hypothetical protein